jgi:hypothetical protein
MRLLLALVLVLTACSSADDGGSGTRWWDDPPGGARWVGYDGVAVAVPDWWTTGETQCGAPVEDTVYFDPGATHDCSDPADLAAVREVSSLAVLHDDGRYDSQDLDGGCEEWFEGVCRRLFALPHTDVIFAVTIDEEGDGDFEEIRDSARILPRGVTVVPLSIGEGGGWTPSWGAPPGDVRALVKAIEDAGLVAEVWTVEPDPGGDVADLPRGSLLDVQPALGTPVEDGSTVTISVMGTSGS